MSISNATLATKISDLIDKWRNRELEFNTWLTGTASGGPSLDGRYNLTDYLGTTRLTKSPARLEADVQALVDGAQGYRDQSQVSASNAAASDSAAAASAASALSERNQALAHKDAAVVARSGAENAMVNAQGAATNAAASETAALASKNAAALSETNSATSETNAAASATAAANSAAQAATFNPALYAALAGAAFTGEVTVSGTAVVLANDARLSDARTPVAHTHAATDITSGTLADARLSSNVPLLNAPNVFTANQRIGSTAPVSDAPLSAVRNGNCFEFGHANPAGYRSTLGAFDTNGRPFLAFNAEHGTTANTFRTRGIVGRILQSDVAGGLIIGRAANANADDQTLTADLTISSAGAVDVVGALTVGGKSVATYEEVDSYLLLPSWLRANAGIYSTGSYVNFQSPGGLQIRDSVGTLKGYVYHDVGGFGLLGSSGAWAIHIPQGASRVEIVGDDIRSNFFYGRSDTSKYLRANEAVLTYGGWLLSGGRNSYYGLAINDGVHYPTLMSNGSAIGVYCQVGTRNWLWSSDGTYFRTSEKPLGPANAPVCYIVSGGSVSGGRITISTAAPSGTPADGDMWFQREA